jgi:uncharacterized protein (TIGR00303 family)
MSHYIESTQTSDLVLPKFSSKNPIFICVASYTQTSEIPGITIAGRDKGLIPYTPAADVEFLYYGRCMSISGVPATPDGVPTPALITRASLMRSNIPLLVVNSGLKITPEIPYISFNVNYGKNIRIQNGTTYLDFKKALEYGKYIGENLSKSNDIIIIGETIPGGTTTALAVLKGIGVDAEFKVSSSMIENPHRLKNIVVSEAIERTNLNMSKNNMDKLELIASLGDPMIPASSGIAHGAIIGGAKVMLAGGTQMCAVLGVLKILGTPLDNICIATTSYVLNDNSSDIKGLVASIDEKVPILSIDLDFKSSSIHGLNMYCHGIAKEGVGAGGAAIASILKDGPNNDKFTLLKSIENEYEKAIAAKHVIG